MLGVNSLNFPDFVTKVMGTLTRAGSGVRNEAAISHSTSSCLETLHDRLLQ
jgi:hypothetical protein